jgi:hypothetical protein
LVPSSQPICPKKGLPLDSFVEASLPKTSAFTRRAKTWLLLACLIAAAILFPGLNSHQIYDDEVIYRGHAENILNGDSLLDFRDPEGAPYFQKPPLYFWLSAATASILGPSEWLPYRRGPRSSDSGRSS